MNAITTVRVGWVDNLYTHDELRVVTREAHIRDLAARLLSGKLAAGGDPNVIYHAALAEAEERLYADF